jgi:nitroreductase
MEVSTAVTTRRSIRKFRPDPLPEGALERILAAAKAAPSAGNLQARDFFVAADAERKARFVEAALSQKFVAEAAVAIVVCANYERIAKYGERGTDLYCLQDAAASVQNMLLTAVELGLGACWVGAFDEAAVSAALDLPKKLRPVAIVPIGVADEAPEPHPQRDDDIHVLH